MGAIVVIQPLDPADREAERLLDRFEEATGLQGRRAAVPGRRRYSMLGADDQTVAAKGMAKMLDRAAPGWRHRLELDTDTS